MKESDFQAKVILFSKTERYCDPSIITVQTRYPRMAHAELMTHRVFSRNARSSRAVPVKNLLKEEIYLPYFKKNKAGMQAEGLFDADEMNEIQQTWIDFAKATQRFSQWLSDRGVHKQWANRPLEWFGYIDTLITSTKWKNFMNLRDHEAAQPEIYYLAKAIKKAIEEAEENNDFQTLESDEWHIPYESTELDLDDRLMVSAARCARISYAPFDGDASIEKELERAKSLRYSNPMHASPFEHQAKYNLDGSMNLPSNLSAPWVQYRQLIDNQPE